MEHPKHFVIDLYDCMKQPLKSTCDVENYLVSVTKYLALKAIGRAHIVKFNGIHPDDDGITGALVLATSLISIHTYPKERACYVDLFACSDYSQDDFLDFTKGWFGGKVSHMDRVKRFPYKKPINYHTNQGLDSDPEVNNYGLYY